MVTGLPRMYETTSVLVSHPAHTTFKHVQLCSLHMGVWLQVCLHSNVKLEYNTKQHKWTWDTASAVRAKNETINLPRMLDLALLGILWCVPVLILICCSTIKVSMGHPGYATLISSKGCACIFFFISPSHGVLYPALCLLSWSLLRHEYSTGIYRARSMPWPL